MDTKAHAKKEEAYRRAVHKWKELAGRKDWDQVVADMEVYAFAGSKIEKDPRRTEEYRNDVVKGLKLTERDTRDDTTVVRLRPVGLKGRPGLLCGT